MLLDKFVEKLDFESYEDFRDNFKIKIPENFNFSYDVVDVFAEEKPNLNAIVWTNDNGDYREFTFSDLKYQSDRTASFFKEQGIKRGDAVMLILKRRYEFWFSILALHKIGAICIPATHMLTKEDIVYRNNAASVKMIVAVNDEDVTAHVESALSESETVERLVLVNGDKEGWSNFESGIDNASPFEKPERDNVSCNEDISLIYFTSGTTSHPRMVAHDFTYPLGHIVTAYYWQTVKKDGLHFTVADTGWGKAVWGKLYGQWFSECAVFIYDYNTKFTPVDILKMIEKHKITSFCAPPTIYRFMIKDDLSQYDLSSLEHCSTAGEPLSEEVFNTFKKLTGMNLMEGFGQTETTLSLANYSWMTPKPGSMGKPSPGYKVHLLRADDSLCEDGETGQIVFSLEDEKIAGLFACYYRDREKTDSVLKDGYYRTGDMAWRDEDGFYWFVGRSDDVIKCSGYRIGSFEVESVLMGHPAVIECAVTGVPDEVRGQVVKASVVLSQDYKPGDDDLVKNIQEYVKKITAPYKYPRIVEFVDELPKTISGKIRRVEIRERN
jgi:acetyl-CoA synthetase